MALHCLYHSVSFETAVIDCINKGGDADSTASVCAQMAGSLYGANNIPSEAKEAVLKWDNQGDLCLKAFYLFSSSDIQKLVHGK